MGDGEIGTYRNREIDEKFLFASVVWTRAIYIELKKSIITFALWYPYEKDGMKMLT